MTTTAGASTRLETYQVPRTGSYMAGLSSPVGTQPASTARVSADHLASDGSATARVNVRRTAGSARAGDRQRPPRAQAARLSLTSSWRIWARCSVVSTRTMSHQPGSNWPRPSAKRADVGAAWWLLCSPSPEVIEREEPARSSRSSGTAGGRRCDRPRSPRPRAPGTRPCARPPRADRSAIRG